MGTLLVTQGGVQDRSQDPVTMTEAELRELVGSLQGELQSLREIANTHADVEGRLEQLREANQHLVLATVSADNRRDEAEQANRRQNEFLAMLAHELRNPLAPISMAATLLERVPDASPQLKQIQSVIGRQVEQMARLLDDLLDAARISSGKITLTLEPVLLADVIERAVETVAPRVAERAQSLVLCIPEQATVIAGNRVRLTQVFSNLLSNASKYTQDGGEISFAAACEGDTVKVTLQDNGTGIDPDVIPHIFDLFTQGPRSLARSEGGLGVGLNVVRNLVHMHGGEVTACSTGLGGGSTFTVSLPVSPCLPEPQGRSEDGRDGAASWNIVLVEDNVDACDTLHTFLAFAGHTVHSTYNGTDGLAAALIDSCDVLVCDIGLPGIDGYSLVRALRAARPGRRPYAIALSGYCQPEDSVLALEAGFDEFIVKPADPAALLALIAGGAAGRRAGAA